MKQFKRISLLLTLSLLISTVVLLATAGAASWPQWRGPSGQGVSEETKLPSEWNATKNIKWKTAIPGRGHSSPIVWGNRIFVTTAIEGEVVPGAKAVKHMDGDKEYVHPDSIGANKKHQFNVIALDRKTGKIVWSQTAFEGNSLRRPTSQELLCRFNTRHGWLECLCVLRC